MTVVASASDRRDQLSRDPVRTVQFRLMIGLVGIGLIGAYVLLRGSAWAFDDNIYLVLAEQHGLTWHWLTDAVFGHFAVGYRLGYSALNHVMPIDYRWVVVLMLLLLGAAAVTFFRVLETLFHRRWLALAMTVWFAGSILFVRAIQWWAFGLQGIPTVLADLLCIYGYLRYQQQPRSRWIALSAISLALGLAFYEKAAFAPLYVALLRFGFLTPNLSWRTVREALRRERWIWLAYVGVLVVWYAGYRYSGANFGNAASPTAAQWARFFEVGWLQSVVPSAFGVGMPWANIYSSTAMSSLQSVEVIVLQVVVAAVVVISVIRDRGAWRAWAVLLFLFGLTGFLTGEARIGLYGPSAMAGDLRYWIDFAWLTPLLVCLAFIPRPQLAGERVHPTTTAPRPRTVACSVAVLLAYVVAAAASAHHMERLWPGVSARSWETNLQNTLVADRRRWPTAVIAQGIVPFYIVEPAVAPLNQLGFVLPHYAHGARLDGPVRGPILTINAEGQAVRATTRVHLRDRVAGCTGHEAAARSIEITRSSQSSLAAGQAYLLANYRSGGFAKLPLDVSTGRGRDQSADPFVGLSPGTHRTLAWLGPNRPTRIRVTMPPLPGLCVRELDIVGLVPLRER